MDFGKSIIDLAREAGFEQNSLGMTYTSGSLSALLERFATLVRAAALEEAAGVCEAQENRVVARHPARIEFDPNSMMARKCAAAIRQLKESK